MRNRSVRAQIDKGRTNQLRENAQYPSQAETSAELRETIESIKQVQKIANGATEAQGNGAGFYGKPYQPGAIIKNDVEYILFLRKGGEYRSPSPVQRALSMLNKDEMQNWMRSSWTDIRGESTRNGHPAP